MDTRNLISPVADWRVEDLVVLFLYAIHPAVGLGRFLGLDWGEGTLRESSLHALALGLPRGVCLAVRTACDAGYELCSPV